MSDPGNPIMVGDVPRLPGRPVEAHKGTFGTVLVVAGSVGMAGAAVLCGSAALRGGAGLVRVAVPEPVALVVAMGNPCYTTAALPAGPEGRLVRSALPLVCELAQQASAVVVGPGLGQSEEVAVVVRGLVEEYAGTLLLDADALNVLGPRPAVFTTRRQLQRGVLLLTPHPGEMARLVGLDTGAVQANRLRIAADFAKETGTITVLKGAGTIVTDGVRAAVNSTGNPGMATGGSGDVLAGLLGALLARGLEGFAAAVLGVHVHGLAGDLARDVLGEEGLIASDLLTYLPPALRSRVEARTGKRTSEPAE